ncbi:MAG: tetratricopeptide repeat protein, partial [Pseudomonadota bacterium]
RLSDLGRREEALSAALRAVEIYEGLASDRPDAFLPNLAMGVSVMGDLLGEFERWDEAVSAQKRALETIVTPFRKFPAAHFGLAMQIGLDYMLACQKAGTEPDAGIFTEVVEIGQRTGLLPEQSE